MLNIWTPYLHSPCVLVVVVVMSLYVGLNVEFVILDMTRIYE